MTYIKDLRRDLNLKPLEEEISRCRRMAAFHDGEDDYLTEDYQREADALRELLDAITTGNLSGAVRIISEMNDSLRDRVPGDLYTTLCRIAETAEGVITMAQQTKKTTKKSTKTKAAKKTKKAAKKRNAKTRRTGKKAATATSGAKKRKRPATGQQAAKQGERKLSCLDAAVKVIGEAKEAMTTGEMFDAMVAKGYWSSDAPTPQNTIYSAILREIKNRGPESRFRKIERGRFGLNT